MLGLSMHRLLQVFVVQVQMLTAENLLIAVLAEMIAAEDGIACQAVQETSFESSSRCAHDAGWHASLVEA